jgi:hypothetical protein
LCERIQVDNCGPRRQQGHAPSFSSRDGPSFLNAPQRWRNRRKIGNVELDKGFVAATLFLLLA